MLLDTNVLSELRRPSRSAHFAAWWQGVDADDLYLSALTFGELEHGIERLRPRDQERTESLEHWKQQMQASFATRILHVDAEVATCWGRMCAGRSRPVVDTLIAATAMVHDLVLVTRNVKDFQELPVAVFNPFD